MFKNTQQHVTSIKRHHFTTFILSFADSKHQIVRNAVYNLKLIEKYMNKLHIKITSKVEILVLLLDNVLN